MSLFFRIYQHLLPRARAWRLTTEKTLRSFFEGISAAPSDARDFVDGVWLEIFPSSTNELVAWEEQFGLFAAEETADRIANLEAEWAAQGGQDPKYLQDTVQAAGFPLYIHEWWSSGPDPYVPRDPRLYTDQPLIGTVQCGEPLAQCGEETAQANGFLANEPGYIVNLDLTPRPPPRVSDKPADWEHFLYWGAETFPNKITVPSVRRRELERLVLRLCPSQQWLVMLVIYSPPPKFMLLNSLESASGYEVVRFDVTDQTEPVDPDDVLRYEGTGNEWGGRASCAVVDEDGVRGEAGLIYVAADLGDNQERIIHVLNQSTMTFRALPLVAPTGGAGIYNPYEMVFDDDGYLWVSCIRQSSGQTGEGVLKIDPTIFNGSDPIVARADDKDVDPRGIVFNPSVSTTDVWVVSTFHGRVERFRKSDAVHQEESTGSSMSSARDAVFDSDGTLWIAGAALYSMPYDTMVVSSHTVVGASASFSGIGYDSKRDRLWLNSRLGNELYVIDPDNPTAIEATISLPSDGISKPRYDPLTDKVYLKIDDGSAKLCVFDPLTQTLETQLDVPAGTADQAAFPLDVGVGGVISYSEIEDPGVGPYVTPSDYDGLVLDLDPNDVSSMTLDGTDVDLIASVVGSIEFATDSANAPQLVTDDPIFNGRNSIAFSRANQTHMTTSGGAGGSGHTLADLLRDLNSISQFTVLMICSLTSAPATNDSDARANEALFGAIDGSGDGLLISAHGSGSNGRWRVHHGSDAGDNVQITPSNETTFSKQRGLWVRKWSEYSSSSGRAWCGQLEGVSESSIGDEDDTPGQAALLELGQVAGGAFGDFRLARLLAWDVALSHRAVQQMIDKYLKHDLVFGTGFDGS